MFSGFAGRPDQMFAARKSSSTGREADAPNLGQRTSGWHQKRCSLDEHSVTYHTLAARVGDITQSRAKYPGAPETSTLSFFHTPHKIRAKHTDEILERHTTWSSFTSCSGRTAPPISTRRHDSTIFQLFFPFSREWKWLEPNRIDRAEKKRTPSQRLRIKIRILLRTKFVLLCRKKRMLASRVVHR